MSTTTQVKPGAKLVITGFSKFCGVEDNPTENLVDWLATLPHSGFHAGTAHCVGINALEVSMKGVDSKLAQLREAVDLSTSPTDIVLWVHFGVASGAQEFRLEAVGYNEADFRCPDEQGEEPRHCPIDPTAPLGAELHTPLPLNALQERLKQKGHPVEVSIDPGRFVCNYVYYRSLQQHQQPPTRPSQGTTSPDSQPEEQNGSAVLRQGGEAGKAAASGEAGMAVARGGSMRPGTSLFVHVPAFKDVPREQQRRFALDLLLEVSRCAPELALATEAGSTDGKVGAVRGVQLTVYH